MFTPLQLSEISFARTRFGGYDMASVDAVLTPLTEDYTAIYNENERLKSKMRSLVKKCEEYRTAAENQRASTGDTKKVCDRMIRDAEARCAQLEDAPCRHPEEALTSLEGYGIDVYRTSKATDLKYINGENTVTYFGIVLFD